MLRKGVGRGSFGSFQFDQFGEHLCHFLGTMPGNSVAILLRLRLSSEPQSILIPFKLLTSSL